MQQIIQGYYLNIDLLLIKTCIKEKPLSNKPVFLCVSFFYICLTSKSVFLHFQLEKFFKAVYSFSVHEFIS